MFLKLTGRKCLVVGAGQVAEAKLAHLLTTRTQILVAAPEATSQIARWAEEGKICWHCREFEERDLAGIFLVVVCTSSRALNAQIYYAARCRGVLCNVVDAPELCDFYYPAIVRRGDLQIAVSTAGRSPALASRIREELEAKFGPEYEELVHWLGTIRTRLFSRNLQPEFRRQVLRRVASRRLSDHFIERLRRKRIAEAL
jgi:precorrin-2 dehydrogenase/sirohydrochlorin ferrochelatase